MDGGGAWPRHSDIVGSRVGVGTWALKAHMIIASSGFASLNRLKLRGCESLPVGDQLSPFV